MIEVAHQAYPDAVLVVFVAVVGIDSAMGSVFLYSPSVSYFDLSVACICTVADDKVVAQLVPAVVSVGLIEPAGSAAAGCAMVDYDVCPAI